MAAQISAIHNFCQLVLSEIICCFRLRHYFDIKKCHRWSQKKFYNFCFNWNSRCNLLALSLLQYFWLLGICWEANWHCISSAECSISWKNCWLFCWCWCQRLSVLLYPLKFLKLVLLGKFMTKILAAINLAQDHKWSIPLASRKLWHQHIISAQLQVIEAQEIHRPKNRHLLKPDAAPRGDSSYVHA